MIKKYLSIFGMSMMICAPVCGASSAVVTKSEHFPVPFLPLAQALSSSSPSSLVLVRDQEVKQTERSLVALAHSSGAVMAQIVPFNSLDEVDTAPELARVAPIPPAPPFSMSLRIIPARTRVCRPKKATSNNEVGASFTCKEKKCGRSFAKAFNLKRHMKKHTGEKTYSCTVCDQLFAEKHQVAAHFRRIHTDERPFVCTVFWCARRFSDKTNCKRHEKKMHNIG